MRRQAGLPPAVKPSEIAASREQAAQAQKSTCSPTGRGMDGHLGCGGSVTLGGAICAHISPGKPQSGILRLLADPLPQAGHVCFFVGSRPSGSLECLPPGQLWPPKSAVFDLKACSASLP